MGTVSRISMLTIVTWYKYGQRKKKTARDWEILLLHTTSISGHFSAYRSKCFLIGWGSGQLYFNVFHWLKLHLRNLCYYAPGTYRRSPISWRPGENYYTYPKSFRKQKEFCLSNRDHTMWPHCSIFLFEHSPLQYTARSEMDRNACHLVLPCPSLNRRLCY